MSVGRLLKMVQWLQARCHTAGMFQKMCKNFAYLKETMSSRSMMRTAMDFAANGVKGAT